MNRPVKLIALLLILCLAVTPALAVNEPIDDAAWQQILQNLANNQAHPVPEEYRIAIQPGDWHASRRETDTITILVMGTDSLEAGQRDGEADVIMVCAISLRTGAIRLLSLPEDVPVQAQGLPGEVWLKDVHCFGGPELMVQTVNDVMGLPMTKYCAVNLNSFVAALDQLGGVRMNLTAYEAEALGLSPGENRLSGIQALNYVKINGEGNRQTRGRALLSALGRQVREGLNLLTVATLLNFVFTAIDTNLTLDNLWNIAIAVLNSPGGLSISTDGADFNAADWQKSCQDFLYGE